MPADSMHEAMFGPCDTRPDFELMNAWGAGDAPAGSALYYRYFPVLYRFFRSRTQDPSELIQQTFLACVQSRARFQHASNFRSYLLSTARIKLCQHYQDLRRHPIREFADVRCADTGTSPCEIVDRKYCLRLLHAALSRLPIDQQLVIELTFWEDMTSSDVAQILDLTETAVRSRLHRAKRRLQTAFMELTANDIHGFAPPADISTWVTAVRQLVSTEAMSL